MSAEVVVLCPGQGAQAVGMGRGWYEASEAARAVFDEADSELGDSNWTQWKNALQTRLYRKKIE